jgi:hypothetical protein
MNKTLLVLIFIGVFLAWNFVLFPEKLDFTDKVKVLQGLSMASVYKTAIGEYWLEKKVLPNAEQWREEESKVELKLENSIVASIKIAERSPGSITIYYTNERDPSIEPEISGKSLTLTPRVDNSLIEWSCKGTVPSQYIPSTCR